MKELIDLKKPEEELRINADNVFENTEVKADPVQTVEKPLYEERFRLATNLKDKNYRISKTDKDFYSVESTKEEVVKVNELLSKLDESFESQEKRDKVRARLEMMLGRDNAHLLLNSQKLGGDSKTMTRVKNSIRDVEQALTAEKGFYTDEDVEALENKYSAAINTCEEYLNTKGSRFWAWRNRKTLVRNELARLKKEAELLSLAKQMDLDAGEGLYTVRSGVELLMIARVYQIGGKMKEAPAKSVTADDFELIDRDEVVEAYEKEVSSKKKSSSKNTNKKKTAKDIINELKEEEKNEEAEVKELTPLEEAKKKLEGTNTNGAAKDILGYFMLGNIRLSELFNPKAKTYDKLSSKEKSILSDMKGIKTALSSFKPGQADTKIITIGNRNDIRLIQNEKNELSIESDDGIKISLGDVKKQLFALERDFYDNPQKYDATDVMSKVAEIPDEVEKMSVGEVTGSRTFMVRYICANAGLKNTDFDNLTLKEIKDIITELTGKHSDMKKAVKAISQKIANINKKREESVNTEAVLELKKADHKTQSDHVDYKIKKDEQKINGWTKEEQRIKDFFAELIYSENTRDQDLRGEQTVEQKGERIFNLIKQNMDVVATLFQDLFIREEKIAKGEEVEPSIISKFLDKLPLFMVSDETGAKIRDNLEKKILSFVKEFRDEIIADENDQELMAEVEALREEEKELSAAPFWDLVSKAKLVTVKAELAEKDPVARRKMFTEGGLPLRVAISTFLELKKNEGKEFDKENKKSLFESLGEVQNEIDKNVDEIADEIKKVMEEYAGELFDDSEGKEKEKEEDPKSKTKDSKPMTEAQIEKAKIKKTLEDNKVEYESREKRKKDAKTRIEELDKKNKKTSLRQSEIQEYNEKIEVAGLEEKRSRKILHKAVDDVAKGDKGQALFLKNVLKSYFGGVSKIDQRSMVASAIRYFKPIEKKMTKDEFEKLSDKKKAEASAGIIGGMFKGAGPMFQKMLQGLPMSAIPKELRDAVDDMKDSLSPIPDYVVKERLDAIVTNSGGKYTKISVEKSLGAASVGQAFLCRIYGPEFKDGKQVVIKMLRPDARNRMMREKKVMDAAAIKTDKNVKGGMYATLQGNFERLQEELDLTIEAKNIEGGHVYDKKLKGGSYDKGHVKSMSLDKDVAPTPDLIVLEKAEGKTVKGFMKDTRRELYNMLGDYLDSYKLKYDDNGDVIMPFDQNNIPDVSCKITAKTFNRFKADRARINEMIEQAKKRRGYLLELSEKWVTEGLFGDGFYHGDLHAGNIMVDDNGATIIDYGNATKLTSNQVSEITKMMVAASMGDADAFLEGFHALIERTDDKTYKKYKDALYQIFRNVLNMGDETDSGVRISVALIKAQELGIELPPAIANFSSCQIRLQNSIADMDDFIKELEGTKKKMVGIQSGNNSDRTDLDATLTYLIGEVDTPQEELENLKTFEADLGLKEKENEEFKADLYNTEKRNEIYEKFLKEMDFKAEIIKMDQMISDYLEGKTEKPGFSINKQYKVISLSGTLKNLDNELSLRVGSNYQGIPEYLVLIENLKILREEIFDKKTKDLTFKSMTELLAKSGFDINKLTPPRFDTSIRQFWAAQDEKKQLGEDASPEEIQKADEKIKKAEENAMRDFRLYNIRHAKFGEDFLRDSDTKIREALRVDHMHKWVKERVRESILKDINKKNNQRLVDQKQLFEPLYSNPKYGAKLKDAYEKYLINFKKYIKDPTVAITMEEINILEEGVQEIIDIYNSIIEDRYMTKKAEIEAKVAAAKEEEEKKKAEQKAENPEENKEEEKTEEKTEEKKKEEKDEGFLGVMGAVIKKNRLKVMYRYGVKRTAKALASGI